MNPRRRRALTVALAVTLGGCSLAIGDFTPPPEGPDAQAGDLGVVDATLDAGQDAQPADAAPSDAGLDAAPDAAYDAAAPDATLDAEIDAAPPDAEVDAAIPPPVAETWDFYGLSGDDQFSGQLRIEPDGHTAETDQESPELDPVLGELEMTEDGWTRISLRRIGLAHGHLDSSSGAGVLVGVDGLPSLILLARTGQPSVLLEPNSHYTLLANDGLGRTAVGVLRPQMPPPALSEAPTHGPALEAEGPITLFEQPGWPEQVLLANADGSAGRRFTNLNEPPRPGAETRAWGGIGISQDLDLNAGTVRMGLWVIAQGYEGQLDPLMVAGRRIFCGGATVDDDGLHTHAGVAIINGGRVFWPNGGGTSWPQLTDDGKLKLQGGPNIFGHEIAHAIPSPDGRVWLLEASGDAPADFSPALGLCITMQP